MNTNGSFSDLEPLLRPLYHLISNKPTVFCGALLNALAIIAFPLTRAISRYPRASRTNLGNLKFRFIHPVDLILFDTIKGLELVYSHSPTCRTP